MTANTVRDLAAEVAAALRRRAKPEGHSLEALICDDLVRSVWQR